MKVASLVCTAVILAMIAGAPRVGATTLPQQAPPLPHAFYGTVSIAGSPAPAGTEICGMIGGQQKGCIVTDEPGSYGGASGGEAKLVVQSDQGDVGATIRFFVTPPGTIGGFAAQETVYDPGEVNELNLTLATPPPTPTPTATPIPFYTLTIQKIGSGSGGVISSPLLGINCGSDCSESYPAGTSVTLFANPSSNSDFGGWGSSCPGGSVVMNANKVCVVTFNQEPQPAPTATPTPTPTPTPSPTPSPTITATPLPPEVEIVETVEEEVEDGGTVSTGTVEEVNEEKPVVAAVTAPKSGTVTISQTTFVQEAAPPSPQGYSFLGRQFVIEAPPASAEEPLVIAFAVHQSLLLDPDTDLENIRVFRNGVEVLDCTGPANIAEPDPCVAGKSRAGANILFDVLTSQASTWNFGTRVQQAATPTPTLTPGPAPSATPTQAPTPSPTPTREPVETPTPTAEPTETPSPTITATATPTTPGEGGFPTGPVLIGILLFLVLLGGGGAAWYFLYYRRS